MTPEQMVTQLRQTPAREAELADVLGDGTPIRVHAGVRPADRHRPPPRRPATGRRRATFTT